MDNNPIPTPIPETQENWDVAIAGKKVAYAIAKWKASVAGGVAVSPVFFGIVEQVNGMSQPWGITIHIDEPLFEKMLPILLFSGLVAIHDYAKIKLADNPTAKKIL